MVICCGHEPFLAGATRFSLQRQRRVGIGKEASYNCVIIQFGGLAAAAKIPPESRTKVNGEEAIDDRVQAGIQEPKDEKDMGQRVGNFPLQVIREEPVPEAQHVVWRPADNEGQNNHNAHFESSHSSSGDVVLRAPQIYFIGGHCG